jgi:hypothetical protein
MPHRVDQLRGRVERIADRAVGVALCHRVVGDLRQTGAAPPREFRHVVVVENELPSGMGVGQVEVVAIGVGHDRLIPAVQIDGNEFLLQVGKGHLEGMSQIAGIDRQHAITRCPPVRFAQAVERPCASFVDMPHFGGRNA